MNSDVKGRGTVRRGPMLRRLVHRRWMAGLARVVAVSRRRPRRCRSRRRGGAGGGGGGSTRKSTWRDDDRGHTIMKPRELGGVTGVQLNTGQACWIPTAG